jgi:N-methylhydantoinase A
VETIVRDELRDAVLTRFADCRYPGQGYEVTVPAGDDPAELAAAFHDAHRTRFGHADPARAVEVVNVRVVGTAEARPGGADDVRTGGREHVRLEGGALFAGPVTIPLEDATVRIEDGWHGRVLESGAILVGRS